MIIPWIQVPWLKSFLKKYFGSSLFDPENPDYSIDLSDNELNDELEDDLNVEFESVCIS